MNIKRIFLVALGLLSLNFAIAQRCAKFGITLTSNEDIAAFKTDYPGCKTVLGDLIVQGPITHIKDLVQIDSVLGKVVISSGVGWDLDFKSFEGLNHLRYVGGDLNLSNNRVLTDIGDFDSLQYVGGSLRILDSDSLKTLDGFPMLQHIGNDLDIGINDSLKSILSFKNITTINGNLRVYNNYVLTDASGLENIRFVGGQFTLHHCFKLTDLQGFKKVYKIMGGASISDMHALESLNGLENLIQIGGNGSIAGLLIENCAKLSDISAIRNVNLTNTYELRIWSNPQLEMCSYFNICQYVRSTKTIYNIGFNKGNCADKVTLKAACAVSSNESISTNRLTFYPNPAKTELNLEWNEFSKIKEVYAIDAVGKKVNLVFNATYNSIDIRPLTNGAYQLEILTDEGKIFRSRMVKI